MNYRISTTAHGPDYSIVAAILVVFSVLFGESNAVAHHSVLPFDQERFIELDGVITRKRWRNPHVRLTLVVDGKNGETQEWELEGGAANAISRKGLDGDSIDVGDRVRVAGWPSKLGRNEMFVINLQIGSGKEYVLLAGEFPPRWADKVEVGETSASDQDLGRSIFRVWDFGSLYAPRKPFVFTASAQAARDQWNPFTDMLAIKCIAPGMPNAMLNPYPIEFIDEGDQIRLRIEEWEATRVIDMVSEQVPDNAPTSIHGYSLGRWDGESLVIETSRVDFPYLDDDGTPMSDQVHMVERFTVSGDGDRLAYEVTVSDPVNLVEPAIWDASWNWVTGTKIMPFECDTE